MCIRLPLQLCFSGIPAAASPLYRCSNPSCLWAGAEPDGLDSVVDWVGFQDTTDIVILPEGQCPDCTAPVYHPAGEHRLKVARAALADYVSW